MPPGLTNAIVAPALRLAARCASAIICPRRDSPSEFVPAQERRCDAAHDAIQGRREFHIAVHQRHQPAASRNVGLDYPIDRPRRHDVA